MTNLSYHLLAGKCNLLFNFLSFSVSCVRHFLYRTHTLFVLSHSHTIFGTLLRAWMDTAIFLFNCINPTLAACMRHRVFCVPSVIFIIYISNGYCLACSTTINNFIAILLNECLHEFVRCVRWIRQNADETKIQDDNDNIEAALTGVVALREKTIERRK